MTDIDVIEQKPITMAALKRALNEIKKEKSELNFRAEKVYAYLSEFVQNKKVDEVYTKLSGLDITKLRDRHIVKIADIMPEDADAVKMLFSGETVTLKQDEIQKVVDIVNG